MNSQRRCRPAPVAGLVAWAIAVVLLGGCNPKISQLGSSTKKLEKLLQSDKPVVVDFYKTLCPTCTMVEPIMNRLANDYDGRVVFGKFTIMNFFLIVTNWEVHDRYDFAFVPTVVLFVNGQEKHRWVWNVDINAYRTELDKYAGPPTTQSDSPQPPGRVVIEAYRCTLVDAKSRRFPQASRGKAVLFDKGAGRIEDTLSLPAGEYDVVLTAMAPDSGHNSLNLTVAGGDASDAFGTSELVLFDKEYKKFVQGSTAAHIRLPKRATVKVTVAANDSKGMVLDNIEFVPRQ